MRRALALVGALALAGCASSLDLERVGKIFESSAEPAPELSSEPNAKLAPVEGLEAVAGELRAIPLRWQPSRDRDVVGYVVERAPEASGPFSYVATVVDRFRTVYVDRGVDLAPKRQSGQAAGGLGHGETYYYRVRPLDGRGRRGSVEPLTVSAATAERPAPPAGLEAHSHLPRRVALRWDPSPDPNVASYVVSRSPSASGQYAELARIEGRYQSVFLDKELPDLGVFYYRVSSVDSTGAIGDPSGAIQAVTKAEPLPPTGLRVGAQTIGENELVWEPNVEADLGGYRLYRRRAAAKELELVKQLGPDETRVRDTAITPGERVAYLVYAFDVDGLRSASSDALTIQAVDYDFVAEPAQGGVELRWAASAQAGLASMRILQLSGGEKEIARVAENHYLHAGAAPGAHVRYQLIGVRSDGSETVPSAVVEARFPD